MWNSTNGCFLKEHTTCILSLTQFVKIAVVNAARATPTHYITNHSSPMAISVTYSKIPYAALETLKGLSSPSSGPTIPKPLL